MKQLVWGDGYDNAPIQEKPLPAVEIDSSNIGEALIFVLVSVTGYSTKHLGKLWVEGKQPTKLDLYMKSS